MDAGLFVAGLLLSLGLFALWIASVRRDARKGSARALEWESDSGAAEMWTTGARCPECHENGALLTRAPGGLVHTCLACGHTHLRTTRG